MCTLDISDFHMLWYNVIMAHPLYESMFPPRFKENMLCRKIKPHTRSNLKRT